VTEPVISDPGYDSELRYIGALFLGTRDVLDRTHQILAPSDFASPALSLVYRAALDRYRKGENFDAALLRASVPEWVHQPMRDALEATTTWTAAPDHARAIRSRSIARRVHAICEDAMLASASPDINARELLDETVSRLRTLDAGSDPSAPVHVSKAGAALLDHLDAAKQGKADTRFVPTGIDTLDSLVCGFRAGQLSIVAARTAIGKSVLALQVAAHASAVANVPTLFVSLEMPSAPDLASRLVAAQCAVPAWKLLQRPHQVTDDEYRRVHDAVSATQSVPLALWDPPRLTVSRLAARCRQMQQSEKGLGLVVLDYLGLLDPSDVRSKAGTREREVAEQSRELKALAMEIGAPVVAVVQLNRQAEGRDGQPPRLHDLRESGSLEMDAYLVMLLSRLGNREENRVLIDVAKHRNGPVGKVEARLDTDAMRLVDARVA
jgi:replicative DNA helicase